MGDQSSASFRSSASTSSSVFANRPMHVSRAVATRKVHWRLWTQLHCLNQIHQSGAAYAYRPSGCRIGISGAKRAATSRRCLPSSRSSACYSSMATRPQDSNIGGKTNPRLCRRSHFLRCLSRQRPETSCVSSIRQPARSPASARFQPRPRVQLRLPCLVQRGEYSSKGRVAHNPTGTLKLLRETR